MNIAISYFYHVRNLKPNQIPVSTAKFDPKWFHSGRDNDYLYLDKNGVINGLRIEELAPGKCCDGLCKGRESCEDYPSSCDFLAAYKAQLAALNYGVVAAYLEEIAQTAKEAFHFTEEPEIVLMVYEAVGNPCSERVSIQEWFAKHGVTVSELKF